MFLVAESKVIGNVVISFIDMPGPLRMGLHNLLVSLHLEAHADSR